VVFVELQAKREPGVGSLQVRQLLGLHLPRRCAPPTPRHDASTTTGWAAQKKLPAGRTN
jgi:hypothetical protein